MPAVTDNAGDANPASAVNTVTFDLQDTPVVVNPVNPMGWYGFNDKTDLVISPTLTKVR